MKVFIVEDAPQTRQKLAEYQKAFGDATELPLTLRSLESWQPAHRHQAHENPFCALLAQANRTCAACLEVQHRAVESAKEGPATVTCFAGLCDTAVPIRLGERTIGFRENRAGETNGASKTPGAGSPRRHPARPERISSHEQ
jgi:hypothetical protein